MSNEKTLQEVKFKREREIIKVSIVNILVNLILSGFKGFVGFLSNSIAIQADAINSLSDALAGIVTIIGIKLSNKDPNSNHPLGYGRYEYLSDGIVAFLVIYAGIKAFSDSVTKIITPEKVDYSIYTIVVLAVAIVFKIFLGLYEKKAGNKNNSKALQASGVDSISDSVVTFTVLLSALLFILFNINIEAYLGLIISVLIIKSGFEMFKDTIDEILGKRVQGDLIKKIKDSLTEEDNVYGAYDLILHSYGPEKYIGSVHIEVPSDLSIKDLDLLERKLTEKVFIEHGVYLSGIGIYSVDVEDKEIIKLRDEITEICMSFKNVLQLHGFVADTENKKIRFDLIIDFLNDDNAELIESVKKRILEKYPDYQIYIQKDINVDL